MCDHQHCNPNIIFFDCGPRFTCRHHQSDWTMIRNKQWWTHTSCSYHTHKQTLAFYLNPDIPRVTRSPVLYKHCVCVCVCVCVCMCVCVCVLWVPIKLHCSWLTDWRHFCYCCMMSTTGSQHTLCPLAIQRKAEAKVHKRPAQNCQHETNCLYD